MFRYKLNENVLDATAMINNIYLTKKWTVFPEECVNLKNYIRTKDVPTGIVDFEEFDRFNQGIKVSSYIDFKKQFPQYTRDILASMKRDQIVEICKAYNITVVNKRNEFLINIILEKQEFFRVQYAMVEKDEQEKMLEGIAERKANEIIDNRCPGMFDDEKKKMIGKIITELKKNI
jgi:hypothetical protein